MGKTRAKINLNDDDDEKEKKDTHIKFVVRRDFEHDMSNSLSLSLLSWISVMHLFYCLSMQYITCRYCYIFLEEMTKIVCSKLKEGRKRKQQDSKGRKLSSVVFVSLSRSSWVIFWDSLSLILLSLSFQFLPIIIWYLRIHSFVSVILFKSYLQRRQGESFAGDSFARRVFQVVSETVF